MPLRVHQGQRRQLNSNTRRVALLDESGATYAWVQFGWSISMGVSPTQSYVRQALIDEANAVLRVSCVYLAFIRATSATL